MTMMLNIKDSYVHQFENFISSLPKDAIEIKNSLDMEIANRISDYKAKRVETTSFENGLNSIREKLVSQI